MNLILEVLFSLLYLYSNKECYTLVPGTRRQVELWPHIWVPLYDTAHEICSPNTKAVEPVATNSQKTHLDVDQCLTETVTLLISVVWQWIPSILSIQLMKNWMPDWLKQSEQPTMTTTNITQLWSPTHKLHYNQSLHSLSQSLSFGKNWFDMYQGFWHHNKDTLAVTCLCYKQRWIVNYM